MPTTRVAILKEGIDVSDDVETRNGRSNPFGWSQVELWHDEKRIGWLESGSVNLYEPGYSFTQTEEGDE